MGIKPKNTDRDKKIKKLRKLGYSLKEIGNKYNISRQRIHQVCGPNSGPGFKYRFLPHLNTKPTKQIITEEPTPLYNIPLPKPTELIQIIFNNEVKYIRIKY